MKKVVSYQSVSLGYIDGRFINATLFVSVDVDDVTICEHYVTINDFREAMKTLRKVEKVAGHSAQLIDRFGFCGHGRWHYVGKTISHCDIRHE